MVLALCASLLAGCGKSGGGASTETQAGGETGPAPASAPAEPTPEQAKAMVASLPAPFNTGDPAHGKDLFAQCQTCHTAAKGGPNMTGPNLYGIFGRKAGSVDGFNYSDGVRALGYTWDAQKIDTWITDPRAVVPDTRMSFPGLKNPQDRLDVIAYLKVATSPPPQ
jgi:cytochrome c